MSVAAISMLKDEADIVDSFIRHTATQVDSIIVSDNGSTDGTREILADLVEEGLIATIYDDPDIAYFQSRKITWLCDRVREFGHDWIVAADADERWVAEDGRPIRDWLLGVPPDVGFVKACVYHYLPTALDDEGEADPFRRIGWRLAEPSALPKVGARLVPGLVVEAGNHGVLIDKGDEGGGSQFVRPPLGVGGLRVNHYSWRSEAQFAKKIVNGARAYALTDLPDEVGPHWRMWGDPYADDLPERAAAHFRANFFAENPPCAPGSDDERGLVYDPAVRPVVVEEVEPFDFEEAETSA